MNHATARYYLHEAQGNIQQAYKMFGECLTRAGTGTVIF